MRDCSRRLTMIGYQPAMSNTDGSFWAPLEAPTSPFSPLDPSLPYHGTLSTQALQSPHPNANPWASPRGIYAQERPLVDNQSMYTPRSEPTGSSFNSHGSRPKAFVHGELVDATYLGDSVPSPVSLDPLQPIHHNPNFRAGMRSGNLVSPTGATTDMFGPQTGCSTHTDPGFVWPSEEKSTVRNPSLQSYSTQSLSPALSNEANPLQSPKLEEEDSDSSHKRSASKSRKKPRRSTHNAIEKRYRVKLNEKIAELRDSIPSLRQQAATTPGGSPLGESSATDPVSGQKINKANILEKATEYVKHLENCNRRLQSELQRARAEAGAQCQHPSHSMPQSSYQAQESSHGPVYGYDTGPPRQNQGGAFYSVEDLFMDDVRQG